MNYSKLVTVVCYLCLVLLSLASCNILPKIICFCLSMCICMKLLFLKNLQTTSKIQQCLFLPARLYDKFNDQFNSFKKKKYIQVSSLSLQGFHACWKSCTYPIHWSVCVRGSLKTHCRHPQVTLHFADVNQCRSFFFFWTYQNWLKQLKKQWFNFT